MNKKTNDAATSSRGESRACLSALGAFFIVLLLLFHRSFQPEQVMFANDGPLGAISADYAREGFRGMWQDLTWVGGYAGTWAPSITGMVFRALDPVSFAKFYGPLCLLILGFSAWLTMRALAFHPVVCVVVGLAAMLNSDFLSYTAWGLGSHALAVACAFLAVAALLWRPSTWVRTALAGFAIGMAVMEGFDSGAFLSLYIAAAVIYQAWGEPGSSRKRMVLGVARLGVVTVAAVWIAACTVATLWGLFGHQVRGAVAGTEDPAAHAQRWDGDTQWSLPKIEALRLIIPGLHGYRLDTPDGGNYWGAIGRDAAWEAYLASPNPDPSRAPGSPWIRHSGAGFYTGIFVVLLAIWGVAQIARGKNSLLDASQRRWVWFWSAVALVSLLLSFGRHAPLNFYGFAYDLILKFSTSRNPVKFLHPFSLAMVILFGYGLQAAVLRFRNGPASTGAWSWSGWWTKAPRFERRFVLGCGAALFASLLGWMIYGSSESNLIRHLQRVGFPGEALAASMAKHSVREVGWYVLFLGLSGGWLVLSLSGFFRGQRAALVAGVMAGLILVVDLTRANLPWIQYYDYREKYTSNAVLDRLRDRAHERRVTGFFRSAGPQADQIQSDLQQVYNQDWMQHLFPYYNIQSVDIVQMPRMEPDTEAFRRATQGSPLRLWELTSTRYLVALAGFVEPLNQRFDAGRGRFRLLTGFELQQERQGGPILAPTNNAGPFGIIEFTGALPKASLYTRWEVVTNQDLALERLMDPAFDPAQSVLVERDPWPGQAAAATNHAGGVVRFERYQSRRLELSAEAAGPSVLLLNDKYHPGWEVRINGRPASGFRANYLMRGVAVPPGKHAITFQFAARTRALWISVAALLCVGLWILAQAVKELMTIRRRAAESRT